VCLNHLKQYSVPPLQESVIKASLRKGCSIESQNCGVSFQIPLVIFPAKMSSSENFSKRRVAAVITRTVPIINSAAKSIKKACEE